MKAVKKWFDNDYPYIDCSSYTKAMEEIKEAIKKQGVVPTKKQLKAVNGSLILRKLYDGEYELGVGCEEVYIDFKKSYIKKLEYWGGGLPGHMQARQTYLGLPLYVTVDQPFFNNYPLSLLIEYGEECEDCGVAFLQTDGEIVCPSCDVALDYSTRAENLLGFEELPKKKNLLGREEVTETLFGIELEYEKVTARQVNKTLKGHAIAKRDGSIQSGVEVVTKPACLATHKKSLKAFYDQVKVKAESNTGMHVHVDKRKLSQYQIGFMLQFLNDPDLISNIETVAGRKYSSNHYCRVKEGTKMTTGLSYDEYSKKIIRAETEKYVPLNTKKPYTIEVRIFSSPESHEEMCAKLDFVSALVKYSSPYSVSVKRLQDKFLWDTFLNFIKSNKKDYPDFVKQFLREG